MTVSLLELLNMKPKSFLRSDDNKFFLTTPSYSVQKNINNIPIILEGGAPSEHSRLFFANVRTISSLNAAITRELNTLYRIKPKTHIDPEVATKTTLGLKAIILLNADNLVKDHSTLWVNEKIREIKALEASINQIEIVLKNPQTTAEINRKLVIERVQNHKKLEQLKDELQINRLATGNYRRHAAPLIENMQKQRAALKILAHKMLNDPREMQAIYAYLKNEKIATIDLFKMLNYIKRQGKEIGQKGRELIVAHLKQLLDATDPKLEDLPDKIKTSEKIIENQSGVIQKNLDEIQRLNLLIPELKKTIENQEKIINSKDSTLQEINHAKKIMKTAKDKFDSVKQSIEDSNTNIMHAGAEKTKAELALKKDSKVIEDFDQNKMGLIVLSKGRLDIPAHIINVENRLHGFKAALDLLEKTQKTHGVVISDAQKERIVNSFLDNHQEKLKRTYEEFALMCSNFLKSTKDKNKPLNHSQKEVLARIQQAHKSLIKLKEETNLEALEGTGMVLKKHLESLPNGVTEHHAKINRLIEGSFANIVNGLKNVNKRVQELSSLPIAPVDVRPPHTAPPAEAQASPEANVVVATPAKPGIPKTLAVDVFDPAVWLEFDERSKAQLKAANEALESAKNSASATEVTKHLRADTLQQLHLQKKTEKNDKSPTHTHPRISKPKGG